MGGAVYILGRSFTSLTPLNPTEIDLASDPARFAVEVDGLPDRLNCQCLISSTTLLPEHLRPQADIIRPTIPSCISPQPFAVARCIAIVDEAITFPCSLDTEDSSSSSDSSLLVFPPNSLEGGSTTSAVQVMTAGSGTMSAPAGKGTIHLVSCMN